eukprot:scaffold5240_cov116-Isochrysis_galbana.AAC.1
MRARQSDCTREALPRRKAYSLGNPIPAGWSIGCCSRTCDRAPRPGGGGPVLRVGVRVACALIERLACAMCVLLLCVGWKCGGIGWSWRGAGRRDVLMCALADWLVSLKNL